MAFMLVLAKLLKDNESRLNGSFLLIGVADEEKGALFLNITSYGKQAHGSTPEKGTMLYGIWLSCLIN